MYGSFVDTGRHFAVGWRDERLESWKDVAAFFRREVRTVQLWEKREGLPIRRQRHAKLGSVYAYRRELEQWWIARAASESGSKAAEAGHSPPGPRKPSPTGDATHNPGTPRILALPFELVSAAQDRTVPRVPDSSIEQLRDDIVFELAQSKLHPVVLPAKAMPRGTASMDFLRTVAKEFGVDLLLSGTIRCVGRRVSIVVHLIEGASLCGLFSQRFEFDDLDGTTSKSSPAASIVRAFQQHALEHSMAPARNRDQPRTLAEDACAIGLHFWKQRSHAGILRAIDYFRDAAIISPACALPYACLADAYVTLSYNHMMPARQAAQHAYDAVQKAMSLDGNSLPVRNALINVLTNCMWDWNQAERQCKRLIDSGQMDSRTIQIYSSLLGCQGRHEEAISLALHAHRLDSLGVVVNNQVSLAYFYGGDYKSARCFAERTIQLRPEFTMGHALVGRIAAESGDWDAALSAARRATELSGHSAFSLALLAYAHAGSGAPCEATEILETLESRSEDDCFPAYDVSAVHAILNRTERALEYLSRARRARDMKTIFMGQDPRFVKLRSSPGFQEIIATESHMM